MIPIKQWFFFNTDKKDLFFLIHEGESGHFPNFKHGALSITHLHEHLGVNHRAGNGTGRGLS